jgi:DNA-binding NtrC family response regulator
MNVVHLHMPSLRERQEDLPLLAGRFMMEAAASSGRDRLTISPEAWEAMERFSWPGNIRQLRNVMHRLVALDDDGKVTVADLPREIRSGRGKANGRRSTSLPLEYQLAKEMATQDFMDGYLDRLLDAHDGNVSQAAKSAGVSRRTLHRWLAEFRPGANG